jgi:hypothetical protein
MSEYSYNAICDSCGFKRKASDLRKRWDGVMVCADTCWEPRNILDFYKTRNDQHVLPFTRSDDTGETDWAPTITGITGTDYTVDGSYIVDSNNVVTYRLTITPSTTSDVVSAAGGTLTLPVGTVSTDRGGMALKSSGSRVGALTASATIAYPAFRLSGSPVEVLTISGSYTKA